MTHDIHRLNSPEAVARRTEQLFREHQQSIYVTPIAGLRC